ncbi:MAG: hypothetical protein KJP04_02145 [Arenicella sp.]|nr:hypothetical protein [Arenicella sp.]
MNRLLILTVFAGLALSACSEPTKPTGTAADAEKQMKQDSNPFYSDSALYMQHPPFDVIQNAHYAPAFE